MVYENCYKHYNIIAASSPIQLQIISTSGKLSTPLLSFFHYRHMHSSFAVFSNSPHLFDCCMVFTSTSHSFPPHLGQLFVLHIRHRVSCDPRTRTAPSPLSEAPRWTDDVKSRATKKGDRQNQIYWKCSMAPVKIRRLRKCPSTAGRGSLP